MSNDKKKKKPGRKKRSVLILGIDGYLGWPLAMHLAQRGHSVWGMDNGSRRKLVRAMGSDSAIPIRDLVTRVDAFGKGITGMSGEVTNYITMESTFQACKPDCIVHLAEQPSAPWSMGNFARARDTQINNVVGTLAVLWAMKELAPDAHLLKLGTMGEYGTPGCPIPEGFMQVNYRGKRKLKLQFPRKPGSLYHASKVMDTCNVEMACRIWGLRSTDVMQGVVYGTRTDEMASDPDLRTRFDMDESFGTAINRFCAAAVAGLPITPYGAGTQKRGFLPLRDSIQCLRLAVEKPPKPGEYRVFNQIEDVYTINGLAAEVARVGAELGLDTQVENVDNPRVEEEEHEYEVDHQHLVKLGYKPTSDMTAELRQVLTDLIPYADRIRAYQEAIPPATRWR
jgi:UDP-sulfoquinovose synthase